MDQGSLKPSVVWRNTVACLHYEQENINVFLPFSLMNTRLAIDAHKVGKGKGNTALRFSSPTLRPRVKETCPEPNQTVNFFNLILSV